MMTVRVAVEVGDVWYKPSAIILFGYPTSLMKLVVKVEYWDDRNDDTFPREEPLEYGAQIFAGLADPEEDDYSMEGHDKEFSSLMYRCNIFSISLPLKSILHKDQIFIQVNIELGNGIN